MRTTATYLDGCQICGPWKTPRSELASEIYSADGVLLGKYFRENRTPVDYADLPQNLLDALIATEDVRFEQHSGH